MKSLFEKKGVWCAGCLTNDKLDEIDECLYVGLCMGTQNDNSDNQENHEEALL